MKLPNILYREFFQDPLAIIRICTGIGLIIHGIYIFNSDYMAGHAAIFEGQYNLPTAMAYISRAAEFLIGILLVLGLFTRFAALILIINMLVATFYVLKGDIMAVDNYQAQLSWLYVIIGFTLFVSKPTAYSLDKRMRENF